MITFNAKVNSEEIFLLQKFGDEYQQYKDQTGKYFIKMF